MLVLVAVTGGAAVAGWAVAANGWAAMRAAATRAAGMGERIIVASG
jgi:hypothetical protein